ncbi:uridine 5'-monophosphate synthase isoform X1 [Lingula anatina]|uniref:Uridine 5'-monophosphate synthase n=2 Tax=Lingula anatina TaxID=7574 RepID=A0A1S3H078_LINAN|nr:uridine 5'-monophosphate synthase isoform X1 [Lingula anatina]|eukprot:XP_013379530.1 uridine 5'-monophosphate synthase isoform X1 [Lingula anatina]
MAGMLSIDEIVIHLFEVQGLKFGNFTMRTGEQTPVYIDMRVICSYPKLTSSICELMWKEVERVKSKYDIIVGVPYTALPLASYISTAYDVPMLLKRKEQKSYGTKKTLEGHYKDGDRILIVDDVVMTGGALLETIDYFEQEGLPVADVVAFFDREQGGVERIKALTGTNVYCVLTISKAFEVLEAAGKISRATIDTTKRYLSDNRFDGTAYTRNLDSKRENTGYSSGNKNRQLLSYKSRADISSNPVGRRLFEIMDMKKTNLALSADLTSTDAILQFAAKVGSCICILKIHADILVDFSSDFVVKLKDLANNLNFLIFEDRKFADIGIVKEQYGGGAYKIVDWADLVNAHAVVGGAMLEELKQVGLPKGRAAVMVAEMSVQGTLAMGDYSISCMNMAEKHKDFIIGFQCRSKLSADPAIVHMVHGVKLEGGSSDLVQHYLTPAEAIGSKGLDILVVGSGILQAPDPLQAAQMYQKAGYDAYLDNVC